MAIDSTAKRAPSKVYNENLRYREIDFVCAHGVKCSDCIFRVNGRLGIQEGAREGGQGSILRSRYSNRAVTQ